MIRVVVKKVVAVAACVVLAVFALVGCSDDSGALSRGNAFNSSAQTSTGLSSSAATAEQDSQSHFSSQLDAAAVPEYAGDPFIEVNGNIPDFTPEEKAVPYGTEVYGKLDSLGRCTGAFALVGRETQPTSKRGNISDIKPSGWKQNLDLYSLGLDHLYERSHLIAYKLTAENANSQNLITGTHYLNQGAMSNFETIVGDYVNATGGHVLMRVTPLFVGDELVARGVQMEAYSLEDDGASVSFNVYCYNVQPGVAIDYATGDSWVE